MRKKTEKEEKKIKKKTHLLFFFLTLFERKAKLRKGQKLKRKKKLSSFSLFLNGFFR
jgi:hypothetical protein